MAKKSERRGVSSWQTTCAASGCKMVLPGERKPVQRRFRSPSAWMRYCNRKRCRGVFGLPAERIGGGKGKDDAAQ